MVTVRSELTASAVRRNIQAQTAQPQRPDSLSLDVHSDSQPDSQTSIFAAPDQPRARHPHADGTASDQTPRLYIQTGSSNSDRTVTASGQTSPRRSDSFRPDTQTEHPDWTFQLRPHSHRPNESQSIAAKTTIFTAPNQPLTRHPSSDRMSKFRIFKLRPHSHRLRPDVPTQTRQPQTRHAQPEQPQTRHAQPEAGHSSSDRTVTDLLKDSP